MMVEMQRLVKAPDYLLGAYKSHRFHRWGAFITGSKKRSFGVFIIRCLTKGVSTDRSW